MTLGSRTLCDVPIRFALWLCDRIAGSFPETEADRIREREEAALTRNPVVRLCVIDEASIEVIGRVDWPEPSNEPILEFDPEEPEPDDLYYAMRATLNLARTSGKKVYWFRVPRRWRQT